MYRSFELVFSGWLNKEKVSGGRKRRLDRAYRDKRTDWQTSEQTNKQHPLERKYHRSKARIGRWRNRDWDERKTDLHEHLNEELTKTSMDWISFCLVGWWQRTLGETSFLWVRPSSKTLTDDDDDHCHHDTSDTDVRLSKTRGRTWRMNEKRSEHLLWRFSTNIYFVIASLFDYKCWPMIPSRQLESSNCSVRHPDPTSDRCSSSSPRRPLGLDRVI